MMEMRCRQSTARLAIVALVVSGVLVAGGGGTAAAAVQGPPAQPSAGCLLPAPSGQVRHVVNVVFDNTHFVRDNPNVPSDLEQMPNLLNFITGSGTLVSHEHTSLISHTGTNILTSLTGLYGDQMGQPVSNAFGFYDTNQFASFRSSFAYWTARLGGKNDNTYFMTTTGGRNTPAPWVPFTRSGCSFGAVATANTVLENTAFDIPAVFGKGSPEDAEQAAAAAIPCGSGSNPPCTPDQKKAKAKPQADFVGIAVHCSRQDLACATAPGARPDLLPDEPGGYSGFTGLFGAKYAGARINPAAPVTDLDGHVIADATGNPGFPGFDAMNASTSLGYVAAMQEHGVPVTYAYISDAHDNHQTGRAFGPGEAGYVAALKAYDDAFGKFFARLQHDGITKDNTLFTFTADEGDHFVGGAPTPAGCDGVHVPCTYQQIGELNASVSGLLTTVPPYSTGTPVPSMSAHADSAPTIYLDGNPGQADPVTRTVERAADRIQAVNPITHQTDKVTNFLAGTAEMRNLHMLTSDPSRNPTFTLFAKPDYYLCAGSFQCPYKGTEVVENPAFAWNHGTVSPDINTTWLGLVGPGVRHLGVDGNTWSSHADDRPTLLALAGLKDGYRHQGRILVEVIQRSALPRELRSPDSYVRLSRVYEQLNSPVGLFGLATLQASTFALASGSPENDATFQAITKQLEELGASRDSVTAAMADILDSPVSTAPGGRARADNGLPNLQQDGSSLLLKAGKQAGE